MIFQRNLKFGTHQTSFPLCLSPPRMNRAREGAFLDLVRVSLRCYAEETLVFSSCGPIAATEWCLSLILLFLFFATRHVFTFVESFNNIMSEL